MHARRERPRPRTIDDPAVSLINQEPVYRDHGDATVLSPGIKQRPIHAVIAGTLANVEALLAHLESGVWRLLAWPLRIPNPTARNPETALALKMKCE